jgi:hypothetical protein
LNEQIKENEMTTKWTRNGMGGYTSKCGNSRIDPQYMGRTTVTAWRVLVMENGTLVRRGSYDTLRDAKNSADRMLTYKAN